ncbi:U6 snRNA-associated Sm-like protein LSm4 [Rhagoletis pomonella]|uniref:U6 snRNA-associated Sm-like protein LSm4 n=1 Tax=Rhagoletis pomonella TaxID=28610 RepID=UPI001786CE8A|nr:U6 snRNA-associated Sm-like protein LSm4 [Rhagoletis pomonella]
MLVELKNGETYNGHLVSCDSWMNINLRDVMCTSKDGDRFWRMPECYVRGSTIKYLRIPDEVIDMVKDDAHIKARNRMEINKGRIGSGAQNQNLRSQIRPRYKNAQPNGVKPVQRAPNSHLSHPSTTNKNRK